MMGELMLSRRRMLPRGKKKAHAVVAMTAWAIRTWCLSIRAGEEKSMPLLAPAAELEPEELNPELGLEPESEFPKFLPPPDHWGEAMVEDEERRRRETEVRIECIL
jgi:hypothetical protein